MRTTSFMAGLGAVLLTVVLVASSPAQEYVLSLVQLTTHPEVDYYPSWSPDGRTIAFSSSRNGGNLWLVPATGGEPEQLTQHEANHPSWSPEGSFIAFDCNRGSEAGIISPHGGLSVRIVPESVPITRGRIRAGHATASGFSSPRRERSGPSIRPPGNWNRSSSEQVISPGPSAFPGMAAGSPPTWTPAATRARTISGSCPCRAARPGN